MGKVSKTTIGQHTIFVDANEPQRWLDVWGPDCSRVVEEFVVQPFMSASNMGGWTTTLVNASTAALTAGAAGGSLLITTAGAENDGVNTQVTGEAFLPKATNRLYFGCKFQVSEATQSDFLIGLAITSTAALGGVTDGIYFRKVDGATAAYFVVETASTETSTAAFTCAATTDYIVEFTWDGSALKFYVNGVLTGTPALTNIPTAEYMSPIVEYLTGSADARTMTVSWLRAFELY
jgi:hypothetical protein